ncbi:hypothetical protein KAR91_81395 [Candidatus Pacearchaeota archaeon]|nr:hypothetical protein [Candidatus Pacearchaeota archaeon]
MKTKHRIVEIVTIIVVTGFIVFAVRTCGEPEAVSASIEKPDGLEEAIDKYAKTANKIADDYIEHLKNCTFIEPNEPNKYGWIEDEVQVWKCNQCPEQFGNWVGQQRHMLYDCAVLHPLADTEKRLDAIELRLKSIEERPYLRICDANEGGVRWWDSSTEGQYLIIEEGKQE